MYGHTPSAPAAPVPARDLLAVRERRLLERSDHSSNSPRVRERPPGPDEHAPCAPEATIGRREGSEEEGLGGAADGGEWSRIAEALRAALGSERYERYLAAARWRPAEADRTLCASLPSPFIASLVQRHLRAEILRALEPLGYTDLECVVHGQVHAADPWAEQPRPACAAPGTAAPLALTAARVRGSAAAGAPALRRFPLEQLVVGACNRLAVSACDAAARRAVDRHAPGAVRPGSGDGQSLGAGAQSLVYIHGPCGTGKTHILEGIAQRTREASPGRGVRSLSGEQFVTEYIGAVRAKNVEPFRRSMRCVDLLCVDDLQALRGRTGTQVELCATIDAVRARGGAVLLSGPEHPRAMGYLSESLRSRLLSGLVAEVRPPDAQTAMGIVRTAAEQRGLVLDEAGVSSLLRRLQEQSAQRTISPRDILGAVTRVQAVHTLLGEPGRGEGRVGLITIDRALGVPGAEVHAGSAGGNGPPGRRVRAVRVEDIRREVCAELEVSEDEVSSRGRHARVVVARAVIAHLSRRLTTLSYPEIARAMHRPNHSTIITACQRLSGQLSRDEAVDLGAGRGQLRLRELVERLAVRLSARDLDGARAL